MISDFDPLFKEKEPQKQEDKIYILNTKARNPSDRENLLIVEMKRITRLPTINHDLGDEKQLSQNKNRQVDSSQPYKTFRGRTGERIFFIF